MSISNNPIDYALNRLRGRMPIEILNLAFFPREEHRTTDATNLNLRIREAVIDNMVMTAMNNRCGVALELDIKPSWIQKISPVICIVNVPKRDTQNRKIINVLNSSFGVSAINNAAVGIGQRTSSYLVGANKAFNSQAPIPLVGTANVNIVGENQLEISDFSSLPTRIKMLVLLQHDTDFTDLRRQYWDPFAELCEQAVKGYCYNNLLGQMDTAFLQGGKELGRLSSKLEEWSDAMDNFDDQYKERWGRILKLNDKILARRNIKMISN